jgi:hypothetical protein
MGLHVYGEGDQIIVQDRPGQGEVFDAYRLLLLEVFIAWNVDHTVAGSPVEGEPSELALLVRQRLEAGFWDLPALQPMPGHAATAAEYEGGAVATRDVLGAPRNRAEVYPRAEAYRQFLRSGLHPSQHPARHAPASWVRPAPTQVFVPPEPWFRSWWAKPRTPTSRVLFWFLNSKQQKSKGEEDAIVALFVFLLSVLLLPFLLAYGVVRLLAHPLYLLVIMVEYVVLPPMVAPPESVRPVRPRASSAPVDPRQPFVQLHDALTYEGFRRLEARGEPIAVEQWLAHAEEVFDDFLALSHPPAGGAR